MELFAENLPGLPDNIRQSKSGGYWVGTAVVRHPNRPPLYDWAARMPFIRNGFQWRIQDFPEEGAPTPRGASTYDFVNFHRKLHENEEILAARGGGGARVPGAPP